MNATKIEPVTIGPTWHRGADGKFVLPEKTLGWQQLGWIADYLEQPDGPDAGEPFKLTDEQARWLLWWSAVDELGEFAWRYAMLRRLKGWGKDPMGSVHCAIEFVGPCRFGGWGDDGQPIGVPNPAAWIQTAAVSREQTRNTMTLFPGLFSKRAVDEFGIDIGKEIIYADAGRRRIEAVTSSPRSLEGGRATFVLKNETHHWRAANEGHEMAAVIARNVAKSRDGAARVMAISNAHAPGEDSDAEHDYEAWKLIEQGQSPVTDMLYDSLEAPENVDIQDDEQVLAAIEGCRGDSHWVSPSRLLKEIRDPRTPPATGRRFYLNQVKADEDKPYDVKLWDELARPGYMPEKGALITLGFDGSLSRDHTALIGTEVFTGFQWVIGYWEPRPNADGDPEIPFAEVDETVDYAFAQWNVWRIYADPHKWGNRIDAWAGKYTKDRVTKWDTTKYHAMAVATAEYRTAQTARMLSHDGDPRFRACIENAVKLMLNIRDDDGELMYITQKERMDSPLRIDAEKAGSISWKARNDAIASGAKPRSSAVAPSYSDPARTTEMAGVRGKEF